MSARIAITLSALDSASYIDALRVLTFANLLWLRSKSRAGAPSPAIYQSGVRFRPEPQAGSGVELYQTIPEVLAQGWGDCDDLTGWRCAELLAQGINADCGLVSVGPRLWHAVVVLPSGEREDVAGNIKRIEVQKWSRRS